jgi:RNA recognition motif-containing protein
LEVKLALRLFIGNLSFKTTEGELETLFAESGSVSSVTIIMDRFSGRSRGFGFIEMGSEEEAQAAIERLNGYEFEGRALTVNVAKPQERRGGGGYGNRDR